MLIVVCVVCVVCDIGIVVLWFLLMIKGVVMVVVELADNMRMFVEWNSVDVCRVRV